VVTDRVLGLADASANGWSALGALMRDAADGSSEGFAGRATEILGEILAAERDLFTHLGAATAVGPGPSN
jgi:hypothetical protein